jgi:hypothetical protein
MISSIITIIFPYIFPIISTQTINFPIIIPILSVFTYIYIISYYFRVKLPSWQGQPGRHSHSLIRDMTDKWPGGPAGLLDQQDSSLWVQPLKHIILHYTDYFTCLPSIERLETSICALQAYVYWIRLGVYSLQRTGQLEHPPLGNQWGSVSIKIMSRKDSTIKHPRVLANGVSSINLSIRKGPTDVCHPTNMHILIT